MSQFEFMPDPALWKLKQAYRKLCSDGEGGKPYLTLIDETLFILCGAKTLDEFKLSFNNYPVDSNFIVSSQVLPNEQYVLFDNKLDLLQRSDPLNPNKQYVRAFVLMIKYPTINDIGNEIEYMDKNTIISITKSSGTQIELPLFNFYSMLCNPISIAQDEIIDKVVIINPNSNYSIYVNALVISVKSTINENDPKCN